MIVYDLQVQRRLLHSDIFSVPAGIWRPLHFCFTIFPQSQQVCGDCYTSVWQYFLSASWYVEIVTLLFDNISSVAAGMWRPLHFYLTFPQSQQVYGDRYTSIWQHFLSRNWYVEIVTHLFDNISSMPHGVGIVFDNVSKTKTTSKCSYKQWQWKSAAPCWRQVQLSAHLCGCCQHRLSQGNI